MTIKSNTQHTTRTAGKRRFGFLMHWILSLDSGWILQRATKMLCALTG